MTTPTKPDVRVRLTAAEAQAQGLVPLDHVWNEDLQTAEPRGMAVERAQLERPMDLAHQLSSWQRNRVQLVSFAHQYLEEASYDAKGSPIAGQLRDYYKVPGGGEIKALTKRGAEKLGTLFRFGKATTEIVGRTETPEYCSATVQVTLADQYRRPIGSAVSSCSTAEAGFRSVFAQRKYGAVISKKDGEWVVKQPGDYRAALNDVVARASKRAFVQAVIVATAADELFTAAEETESKPPDPDEAREPTPAAPQPTGPTLPNAKALKQYAGKPLATLAPDVLIKIAVTLREKSKNPQTWAPVIEAIDNELERRRVELMADEDEDLGL